MDRIPATLLENFYHPRFCYYYHAHKLYIQRRVDFCNLVFYDAIENMVTLFLGVYIFFYKQMWSVVKRNTKICLEV